MPGTQRLQPWLPLKWASSGNSVTRSTRIVEIASSLGLDPDKFEKEMKSKEIQSKINKDISEAEKAGATGTPTVFVNGRRLRDRSVEGFQDIINTLLNKKR